MTADHSGLAAVRQTIWVDARSNWARAFIVAAGLSSSILFIVVGLAYELQIYGDGAIFAYADAVQDAWAFHWHNISGRLTTYIFCHLPAEASIALTGNARIGIVVYGFLFFIAPLLGLIATYAVDRSKGRLFFSYACFSTACLCPLIFGFPTEMWIAHSLFWPALTICHYGRRDRRTVVLIFLVLLALLFTHESGLLFVTAIVATLSLRGLRDAAFRRAAGIFILLVPIWIVVKILLPPDPYIAAVLAKAALTFFDIDILKEDFVLLLMGTLAGYGIAFFTLRRFSSASAHIYALVPVAAALAVYWLKFDHALHAENRYYLRTVVFITTLILGGIAALRVLDDEGRVSLQLPLLPRLTAIVRAGIDMQALAGALALVLLVHTVETAKFVTAWSDYKVAVRALAMSDISDPELGNPRFVSAARIDRKLAPLFWPSTTLFLSVLVAPQFAPARLVVDPTANYIWLSCRTAKANELADRIVPVDARRLIRIHECEHPQAW